MRSDHPVLRGGAAVLCGVGLTLPAALPAAAAPPTGAADTAVTATFDRGSYHVGDKVTMTVVVTNKGSATAGGVRLRNGGFVGGVDWAGGPPDPAPFNLAPGASKTLVAHGSVSSAGYDRGYINDLLYFAADTGENRDRLGDNFGRPWAAVPGGHGTLVLRAVESGDSRAEDGPPVTNVLVTVTDAVSHKVYTTGKTGSSGRLELHHVPASRYEVVFTAPAGWRFTPDERGYAVSRFDEPVGNGTTETAMAVLSRAGESAAPQQPAPSPTATATATASTTARTTASATPAPAGAAPASAGAGSGLPVTGSASALVAGAGLAALAVGAVAIRTVRRRRPRFVASD
ncbi:hypothetical protein HC031_23095 [Planosporangium thailandense]|uniref:DUF11 domain-containing protein n=1 Tax=Planosporangium thailandense TaxID=765197 RepID=A0ABX0Y3C6_9ACTN|nr:hypothetical protein [Planosporangium thailandense]NJC72581.1 hypothetical protein [Planosporangium thailandense]